MDEFPDFEIPPNKEPPSPRKPRPKPTRRKTVKKKAVVKARKPRVVTAQSRMGVMFNALVQINHILGPLTQPEREQVFKAIGARVA